MASEKLRQREVHRYYQAWLDSSVGFDAAPSSQPSRYHADGSQLKVSKDKTLIAFAQLGCLRLDIKRSVVTLISTDQQYILAEATKTLSLVSGDGDFEAQDQIWFGNASLPRSQGISGDALRPPMYTAVGTNGKTYAAPALVINDLRLHDVYKSRAYTGKGVTFYSGVPILTESGIPIGVYTLSDDKPRDGLTPDELRFMHDMAATVMGHLDVVSSEAARFRGETMVLGLGRFISGERAMDEGPESTGRNTQAHSPNLHPPHTRSTREFKGMTITAANPSKIRSLNSSMNIQSPRRPSDRKSVDFLTTSFQETHVSEDSSKNSLPTTGNAPEVTTRGQEAERQQSRRGSDTPSHLASTSDTIFSRAAKILQECVAADGVLFFDAVSTNFTKRSNITEIIQPGKASSVDISSVNPTTEALGEITSSSASKRTSVSYHSGVSEESDVGGADDVEERMSKLLGHALDSSGSTTSDLDLLDNIQLTERSLSRLVKLYPQGKLFSFHTDGGVSASEAEHLTEHEGSVSNSTRPDRFIMSDGSRRIPRAIAQELKRLVPYAQSIVWLPLWDFSKQRWSAGLFLWSRRPDRLVAAQDDLVYLKAFANSIMVEVARQDAAIADTAKSTFIANISHELRTPLHGIIGNLDILQDTKLTDFQQSLVTAIEVCGRTLSDTIDHVLDYSKINQLNKFGRSRQKSNSTALNEGGQGSTTQSGGSTTEENFDIAIIVEEAIEAAYASHVFQSSGRSRLRASSITNSQSPNTASPASDEIRNVNIIFEPENRNSWEVYSQPSAVRRVVTNLFSNALKYTDTGSIRVAISSPRQAKRSGSISAVPILLSVKDTGRGMSADFVRNHAFTPFSQESQFSIGTGLGLSIVQQIVRSLGGRIELQSNQGVGTEIRVFLNLMAPTKEEIKPHNTSSVRLHSISQNTSGLSMLVAVAKGRDPSQFSTGLVSAIASIEAIAKAWFGLRIVRPNISGSSQSSIIMYMMPPTWEELIEVVHLSTCQLPIRFLIVVSNTIEKAKLTTKYAELGVQTGFHVDVISYPVGPQKLGQILLKHLQAVKSGMNLAAPKHGTSDNTTSSNLSVLSKELHSSIPEGEMMASNCRESNVAMDLQIHSTTSAKSPSDTNTTITFPSKASMEASTMPLPAESHVRPPPIMPRSISAPAPRLLNDSGTSTQSPLRVLLVDDNDINLNILKTCMKRAKIAFDFAKDGLEASNTFQHAFNTEAPFTHVLMDISMPVMDGIQSTREIREFERKQSSSSQMSSRAPAPVPDVTITPPSMLTAEDHIVVERAFVIALSGVASETTQLEMLEAGADMFLPKPVKLRELLKILQT